MPGKGSSSISAQDLLALLDSDCKNGFLRHKVQGRFTKSIKWKHHFIVLAHNAIYVFENEMSKSPSSSIPLLGYIAVEREKASACAWVFSLVPRVPSVTRKSFACSNDAERKNWMRQIKEHLYNANNVKDRVMPSQVSKTPSMADTNRTPEEQEYIELELPVISPEGVMDKAETSGDRRDDDSSEDEMDSDVEEEDEQIDALKKKFSSAGSGKRNSDEVNPIQIAEETDENITKPPRYSAIIHGQDSTYVNITSNPLAKDCGLEKACTIVDEALATDRAKCIEMLKDTKKIGTYLIRRSRTQDYKVLSILFDENTVREFRIAEKCGLYHFLHDDGNEFPSVESLLAFYSSCKPIPIFRSYLGYGIHEWGSGSGCDLYEEPIPSES